MTVKELIMQLKAYPCDMEVIMARVFDGEVDGKLYCVNKVRMKEFVDTDEGMKLATDSCIDEFDETAPAVIIFPEA